MISKAFAFVALFFSAGAVTLDIEEFNQKPQQGDKGPSLRRTKSDPTLNSHDFASYWESQREFQRDPDRFIAQSFNMIGKKKIWRYTQHFLPVVEDIATGTFLHVKDPTTHEDVGVAYKCVWAYTLTEVDADAPVEVHHKHADKPYEDEEPVQRFKVEPLPEWLRGRHEAHDPMRAAWDAGFAFREDDHVPSFSDLPAFQNTPLYHMAVAQELAMTSRRSSTGVDDLPALNVVESDRTGADGVFALICSLVSSLRHLNPEATTSFTAVLADSQTDPKFADTRRLSEFSEDDFNHEQGPVFYIKGQITSDKISMHSINGRAISNDNYWETLVSACGDAFRAKGLTSGLRAVGFGGETPDPEDAKDADDLASLQSIVIAFLKASMWLEPSEPVGVRIFLRKGDDFVSFPFVLNNGNDDTLYAFSEALVQAAAATKYMTVQLVRTRESMQRAIAEMTAMTRRMVRGDA